jgi:hypothetical protein
MHFSSTPHQNARFLRQTSNLLAQPEIAPGDIEMDNLGYMQVEDYNNNETTPPFNNI